LGNPSQVAGAGPLCALVGLGVRFDPGSCGRLPRTPTSAGPCADPDTCTKPGLSLGTWPDPLLAASVLVIRSCAVVELLPAQYECRLLSLMVARVVLRRSAAAR